MKKIKKIKKYVEFISTLIKQKITQKTWEISEEEGKLKYMLDTVKESKDLVIVFSACTRSGIPARYNYVRTLKDFRCNKLFILDDLSEDKRGCYYLGKQPEYPVEKAVEQLIERIKKQLNIQRVFYVGSSKGGWAAINFGLSQKDSIIIVGAPQYKLGQYLSAPANKMTLNAIVSKNYEEGDIEELDKYLERKIENNHSQNQKIYLHFSSKEHTYEEHILYLIKKLQEYSYEVYLDEKDYIDHSDVSLFYPDFLRRSLSVEGIDGR